MDITVKILDLPNIDFPDDSHYIIVESADLNETQRTSLRQLYSYIAKQGIVTNVISNQKGIEVTGDNTIKYIKWMPVNWESNIEFKKDDLIIYNHILYKCLIEHTSGDTFNSAYFESIGADIQAATANSLGLVKPDGQTIMINSDGMISTSSRNGIFWHVSATEPTENLSTTDYWLNTTTGEIKQYNGSEWGESLGTMRGPEGLQGLRGLKGDKGDKGDTGEAGAQGEKGERGPQGVQGLTGPQGPQGEAGASFTYDMFTEEQLKEITGPQGDIGPQGPQGETGAAFTYDMFTEEQLALLVGPQGKSAYDVAVDEGFSGTEEDWLNSLKGSSIENIVQENKIIKIFLTDSETPYSFTIPGGVGEWIDAEFTAERFNDYTTSITFTPGKYGHMEGYQTQVTGIYGHAEGLGGIVSGEAGHVENSNCAAIGKNSHAGGNGSRALEENSFTHGEYVQAANRNSAAFGEQTSTSRDNQFVTGAFNEDDETALFIIGSGSISDKKNIFVVDENGNVKISGTVSADGGFEGVTSDGGTISNWQSNTEYTQEALVIYNNTIYQCNIEHTSTEAFDETYWTSISGGSDGITPHIDETTKHWFIGEEDTGILAEGVTTVETSAIVYNGSLIANSWLGDSAPYTQTIVMENMTENTRPYLYPVLSDDVETGLEQQKQWNYITKAVTSNGVITFSCYKTKPTIDINFEAEVR